jgi:hypothetical protein
MSGTLEATRQTMEVIAEAMSHFDPSVHGKVTYAHESVGNLSVDEYWEQEFARNVWVLTEKGEHSRYGNASTFDPDWLRFITAEDHQRIAAFTQANSKSYWSMDGMFIALQHQIVSSNPSYAHTLRNFLLLHAEIREHVLLHETEDCYTRGVVQGLGGEDIGTLSMKDQEGYRALAVFSVEAYLAQLCGRHGRPNAVQEVTFPGDYAVQEPFRSMVWEHPNQVMFMIEYLTTSYTSGDEQHLLELLAKNTPTPLLAGLL